MMQTKAGKSQLKEIRKKNALKNNGNIYDGDTVAGCTANVCLITKNEIYCANAGDSRSVAAFLDGKTFFDIGKTKKLNSKALSTDHKPENAIERKRIINAGGIIDVDGRINGNLNLSRSLGDFSYKKNNKLKAN